MGDQIKGLAFFAVGYTLFYWAVNILVDAYLPKSANPMNPAPLAVLFGISDPIGQFVPTQGGVGPNSHRGRGSGQWHRNPTAANPNPNVFAQAGGIGGYTG